MIFLKKETEDKKEVFCIDINSEGKLILVYYYSFLLKKDEWIEHQASNINLSFSNKFGKFNTIKLLIEDIDREMLLEDLCEAFEFKVDIPKESKMILLNKLIESNA